jgi:hypothetical protein
MVAMPDAAPTGAISGEQRLILLFHGHLHHAEGVPENLGRRAVLGLFNLSTVRVPLTTRTL